MNPRATDTDDTPRIPPSRLEPLPELARFAFDWAPVLCDPAQGCEPYHRAWSAIRLFDQQGASPSGWCHLWAGLRELGGARPLRVMISGCADTGLLAIVASAFPDPAEVEIVLVERCETTVRQNQLYARHLRRAIALHACDIREVQCAPVDAVIGHSFLGYFPDQERTALAAAWRRLLKPGGVLLLSNRLTQAEPAPTMPPVQGPVPEARLAALRDRAAAHQWSGRDLDTLEAAARNFWSIPPRPKVAEQSVRRALEDAGFTHIRIEYPGAEDSPFLGPRAGNSTLPRAHISAMRPAS